MYSITSQYKHVLAYDFPSDFHLRYIESNGGNVPISLKEFQHVFSSLGSPPSPVERVEARHFENCTTPYSDSFDDNVGIPTLKDLGFVDVPDISMTSLIQGGEDEALRHFENFIEQVCSTR